MGADDGVLNGRSWRPVLLVVLVVGAGLMTIRATRVAARSISDLPFAEVVFGVVPWGRQTSLVIAQANETAFPWEVLAVELSCGCGKVVDYSRFVAVGEAFIATIEISNSEMPPAISEVREGRGVKNEISAIIRSNGVESRLTWAATGVFGAWPYLERPHASAEVGTASVATWRSRLFVPTGGMQSEPTVSLRDVDPRGVGIDDIKVVSNIIDSNSDSAIFDVAVEGSLHPDEARASGGISLAVSAGGASTTLRLGITAIRPDALWVSPPLLLIDRSHSTDSVEILVGGNSELPRDLFVVVEPVTEGITARYVSADQKIVLEIGAHASLLQSSCVVLCEGDALAPTRRKVIPIVAAGAWDAKN